VPATTARHGERACAAGALPGRDEGDPAHRVGLHKAPPDIVEIDGVFMIDTVLADAMSHAGSTPL
jgi:hypothetical protein